MIHNTDRKTLEAHVHRFTLKQTTCYTDEWQSYNHIIREHKTVCHAVHEWARDDDGDGIPDHDKCKKNILIYLIYFLILILCT